MVYKTVNGLVAIPIGQYIKLQRNGVQLQNIAAKPKYYEYSFFPRTVSGWNSLPRDFLLAKSLAIFQTRIATLTHVLPYQPLSPQTLFLSCTPLTLSSFYLLLTDKFSFSFSFYLFSRVLATAHSLQSFWKMAGCINLKPETWSISRPWRKHKIEECRLWFVSLLSQIICTHHDGHV